MIKSQPNYKSPYTLTGASVDYFADQLFSGWRVAKRLKLLKSKQINKILVCGMGGSALGADILCSALEQQLKKPLLIVNGYDLPNWTDRQTLVICASYSGKTIETTTCFKQALKKRLPLVAIAKGEQLARLAKKHKVPLVIIDDKIFNPSKQPRLGLGFQLGALLAILFKAKAVGVTGQIIINIVEALKKTVSRPAKTLVQQLKHRLIVVLGVGYLRGAAHATANQLNENAKVVAVPFGLPEADHHLLEGLAQLRRLRWPAAAIMLIPKNLPKNLLRQTTVTTTVLKKQGLTIIKWQPPKDTSLLLAALQAAQWGARLSLSLAQATKINPLLIPWVDFLKRQLK